MHTKYTTIPPGELAKRQRETRAATTQPIAAPKARHPYLDLIGRPVVAVNRSGVRFEGRLEAFSHNLVGIADCRIVSRDGEYRTSFAWIEAISHVHAPIEVSR